MINHHLAGDALIHCLKVAGGKLLLVDEDAEVRQRIEDVRGRIEGDLGMEIRILDRDLKGEILRLEPKRPEDELRSGIDGKFPMCLFYTRFDTPNGQIKSRNILIMLTAAQRATRKHVPLKVDELASLPVDECGH